MEIFQNLTNGTSDSSGSIGFNITSIVNTTSIQNETLWEKVFSFEEGFPWSFFGYSCLLAFGFLFYSLFTAQLLGRLLSFVVNTFLLDNQHELHIGSLKLAPLGGKVLFSHVRYSTKNTLIHILDGVLEIRWWCRRVREAPAETHIPCRLNLRLIGMQYFMFNNSYAYDTIAQRFKNAKDGDFSVPQPVCEEAYPPGPSKPWPLFYKLFPVTSLDILRGAVYIGNQILPTMLQISFTEGELQHRIGQCPHENRAYDWFRLWTDIQLRDARMQFVSNGHSSKGTGRGSSGVDTFIDDAVHGFRHFFNSVKESVIEVKDVVEGGIRYAGGSQGDRSKSGGIVEDAEDDDVELLKPDARRSTRVRRRKSRPFPPKHRREASSSNDPSIAKGGGLDSDLPEAMCVLSTGSSNGIFRVDEIHFPAAHFLADKSAVNPLQSSADEPPLLSTSLLRVKLYMDAVGVVSREELLHRIAPPQAGVELEIGVEDPPDPESSGTSSRMLHGRTDTPMRPYVNPGCRTLLCYGPWLDRQRDVFQRFFYPPDTAPYEEYVPKVGTYRLASCYEVSARFLGSTIAWIPYKTQKNDPLASSVGEPPRPNEEEAAPDGVEAANATGDRADRFSGPIGDAAAAGVSCGWIAAQFSGGSWIRQSSPWIAGPTGWTTTCQVHLLDVSLEIPLNVIGSKTPNAPFVVAKSLELSWTGITGLTISDTWQTSLNLNLNEPRMSFLNPHNDALADLFADFGQKETLIGVFPLSLPPDQVAQLQRATGVLAHTPCSFYYSFTFQDLNLRLNASKGNVVDSGIVGYDDYCVMLKVPRLVTSMTIAWPTFQPQTSEIVFRVVLDTPQRSHRRDRQSATVERGCCLEFLPSTDSPLRLLSKKPIPVACFSSLIIGGSYFFHYKVAPGNQDVLQLNLSLRDCNLLFSASVIERALILSDNYFSETKWMVDTAEFIRNGCRNVRSRLLLRPFGCQKPSDPLDAENSDSSVPPPKTKKGKDRGRLNARDGIIPGPWNDMEVVLSVKIQWGQVFLPVHWMPTLPQEVQSHDHARAVASLMTARSTRGIPLGDTLPGVPSDHDASDPPSMGSNPLLERWGGNAHECAVVFSVYDIVMDMRSTMDAFTFDLTTSPVNIDVPFGQNSDAPSGDTKVPPTGGALSPKRHIQAPPTRMFSSAPVEAPGPSGDQPLSEQGSIRVQSIYYSMQSKNGRPSIVWLPIPFRIDQDIKIGAIVGELRSDQIGVLNTALDSFIFEWEAISRPVRPPVVGQLVVRVEALRMLLPFPDAMPSKVGVSLLYGNQHHRLRPIDTASSAENQQKLRRGVVPAPVLVRREAGTGQTRRVTGRDILLEVPADGSAEVTFDVALSGGAVVVQLFACDESSPWRELGRATIAVEGAVNPTHRRTSTASNISAGGHRRNKSGEDGFEVEDSATVHATFINKGDQETATGDGAVEEEKEDVESDDGAHSDVSESSTTTFNSSGSGSRYSRTSRGSKSGFPRDFLHTVPQADWHRIQFRPPKMARKDFFDDEEASLPTSKNFRYPPTESGGGDQRKTRTEARDIIGDVMLFCHYKGSSVSGRTVGPAFDPSKSATEDKHTLDAQKAEPEEVKRETADQRRSSMRPHARRMAEYRRRSAVSSTPRFSSRTESGFSAIDFANDERFARWAASAATVHQAPSGLLEEFFFRLWNSFGHMTTSCSIDGARLTVWVRDEGASGGFTTSVPGSSVVELSVKSALVQTSTLVEEGSVFRCDITATNLAARCLRLQDAPRRTGSLRPSTTPGGSAADQASSGPMIMAVPMLTPSGVMMVPMTPVPGAVPFPMEPPPQDGERRKKKKWRAKTGRSHGSSSGKPVMPFRGGAKGQPVMPFRGGAKGQPVMPFFGGENMFSAPPAVWMEVGTCCTSVKIELKTADSDWKKLQVMQQQFLSRMKSYAYPLLPSNAVFRAFQEAQRAQLDIAAVTSPHAISGETAMTESPMNDTIEVVLEDEEQEAATGQSPEVLDSPVSFISAAADSGITFPLDRLVSSPPSSPRREHLKERQHPESVPILSSEALQYLIESGRNASLFCLAEGNASLPSNNDAISFGVGERQSVMHSSSRRPGKPSATLPRNFKTAQEQPREVEDHFSPPPVPEISVDFAEMHHHHDDPLTPPLKQKGGKAPRDGVRSAPRKSRSLQDGDREEMTEMDSNIVVWEHVEEILRVGVRCRPKHSSLAQVKDLVTVGEVVEWLMAAGLCSSRGAALSLLEALLLSRKFSVLEIGANLASDVMAELDGEALLLVALRFDQSVLHFQGGPETDRESRRFGLFESTAALPRGICPFGHLIPRSRMRVLEESRMLHKHRIEPFGRGVAPLGMPSPFESLGHFPVGLNTMDRDLKFLPVRPGSGCRLPILRRVQPLADADDDDDDEQATGGVDLQVDSGNGVDEVVVSKLRKIHDVMTVTFSQNIKMVLSHAALEDLNQLLDGMSRDCGSVSALMDAYCQRYERQRFSLEETLNRNVADPFYPSVLPMPFAPLGGTGKELRSWKMFVGIPGVQLRLLGESFTQVVPSSTAPDLHPLPSTIAPEPETFTVAMDIAIRKLSAAFQSSSPCPHCKTVSMNELNRSREFWTAYTPLPKWFGQLSKVLSHDLWWHGMLGPLAVLEHCYIHGHNSAMTILHDTRSTSFDEEEDDCIHNVSQRSSFVGNVSEMTVETVVIRVTPMVKRSRAKPDKKSRRRRKKSKEKSSHPDPASQPYMFISPMMPPSSEGGSSYSYSQSQSSQGAAMTLPAGSIVGGYGGALGSFGARTMFVGQRRKAMAPQSSLHQSETVVITAAISGISLTWGRQAELVPSSRSMGQEGSVWDRLMQLSQASLKVADCGSVALDSVHVEILDEGVVPIMDSWLVPWQDALSGIEKEGQSHNQFKLFAGLVESLLSEKFRLTETDQWVFGDKHEVTILDPRACGWPLVALVSSLCRTLSPEELQMYGRKLFCTTYLSGSEGVPLEVHIDPVSRQQSDEDVTTKQQSFDSKAWGDAALWRIVTFLRDEIDSAAVDDWAVVMQRGLLLDYASHLVSLSGNGRSAEERSPPLCSFRFLSHPKLAAAVTADWVVKVSGSCALVVLAPLQAEMQSMIKDPVTDPMSSLPELFARGKDSKSSKKKKKKKVEEDEKKKKKRSKKKSRSGEPPKPSPSRRKDLGAIVNVLLPGCCVGRFQWKKSLSSQITRSSEMVQPGNAIAVVGEPSVVTVLLQSSSPLSVVASPHSVRLLVVLEDLMGSSLFQPPPNRSLLEGDGDVQFCETSSEDERQSSGEEEVSELRPTAEGTPLSPMSRFSRHHPNSYREIPTEPKIVKPPRRQSVDPRLTGRMAPTVIVEEDNASDGGDSFVEHFSDAEASPKPMRQQRSSNNLMRKKEKPKAFTSFRKIQSFSSTTSETKRASSGQMPKRRIGIAVLGTSESVAIPKQQVSVDSVRVDLILQLKRVNLYANAETCSSEEDKSRFDGGTQTDKQATQPMVCLSFEDITLSASGRFGGDPTPLVVARTVSCVANGSPPAVHPFPHSRSLSDGPPLSAPRRTPKVQKDSPMACATGPRLKPALRVGGTLPKPSKTSKEAGEPRTSITEANGDAAGTCWMNGMMTVSRTQLSIIGLGQDTPERRSPSPSRGESSGIKDRPVWGAIRRSGVQFAYSPQPFMQKCHFSSHEPAVTRSVGGGLSIGLNMTGVRGCLKVFELTNYCMESFLDAWLQAAAVLQEDSSGAAEVTAAPVPEETTPPSLGWMRIICTVQDLDYAVWPLSTVALRYQLLSAVSVLRYSPTVDFALFSSTTAPHGAFGHFFWGGLRIGRHRIRVARGDARRIDRSLGEDSEVMFPPKDGGKPGSPAPPVAVEKELFSEQGKVLEEEEEEESEGSSPSSSDFSSSSSSSETEFSSEEESGRRRMNAREAFAERSFNVPLQPFQDLPEVWGGLEGFAVVCDSRTSFQQVSQRALHSWILIGRLQNRITPNIFANMLMLWQRTQDELSVVADALGRFFERSRLRKAILAQQQRARDLPAEAAEEASPGMEASTDLSFKIGIEGVSLEACTLGHIAHTEDAPVVSFDMHDFALCCTSSGKDLLANSCIEVLLDDVRLQVSSPSSKPGVFVRQSVAPDSSPVEILAAVRLSLKVEYRPQGGPPRSEGSEGLNQKLAVVVMPAAIMLRPSAYCAIAKMCLLYTDALEGCRTMVRQRLIREWKADRRMAKAAEQINPILSKHVETARSTFRKHLVLSTLTFAMELKDVVVCVPFAERVVESASPKRRRSSRKSTGRRRPKSSPSASSRKAASSAEESLPVGGSVDVFLLRFGEFDGLVQMEQTSSAVVFAHISHEGTDDEEEGGEDSDNPSLGSGVLPSSNSVASAKRSLPLSIEKASVVSEGAVLGKPPRGGVGGRSVKSHQARASSIKKANAQLQRRLAMRSHSVRSSASWLVVDKGSTMSSVDDRPDPKERQLLRQPSIEARVTSVGKAVGHVNDAMATACVMSADAIVAFTDSGTTPADIFGSITTSDVSAAVPVNRLLLHSVKCKVNCTSEDQSHEDDSSQQVVHSTVAVSGPVISLSSDVVPLMDKLLSILSEQQRIVSQLTEAAHWQTTTSAVTQQKPVSGRVEAHVRLSVEAGSLLLFAQGSEPLVDSTDSDLRRKQKDYVRMISHLEQLKIPLVDISGAKESLAIMFGAESDTEDHSWSQPNSKGSEPDRRSRKKAVQVRPLLLSVIDIPMVACGFLHRTKERKPEDSISCSLAWPHRTMEIYPLVCIFAGQLLNALEESASSLAPATVAQEEEGASCRNLLATVTVEPIDFVFLSTCAALARDGDVDTMLRGASQEVSPHFLVSIAEPAQAVLSCCQAQVGRAKGEEEEPSTVTSLILTLPSLQLSAREEESGSAENSSSKILGSLSGLKLVQSSSVPLSTKRERTQFDLLLLDADLVDFKADLHEIERVLVLMNTWSRFLQLIRVASEPAPTPAGKPKYKKSADVKRLHIGNLRGNIDATRINRTALEEEWKDITVHWLDLSHQTGARYLTARTGALEVGTVGRVSSVLEMKGVLAQIMWHPFTSNPSLLQSWCVIQAKPIRWFLRNEWTDAVFAFLDIPTEIECRIADVEVDPESVDNSKVESAMEAQIWCNETAGRITAHFGGDTVPFLRSAVDTIAVDIQRQVDSAEGTSAPSLRRILRKSHARSATVSSRPVTSDSKWLQHAVERVDVLNGLEALSMCVGRLWVGNLPEIRLHVSAHSESDPIALLIVIRGISLDLQSLPSGKGGSAVSKELARAREDLEQVKTAGRAAERMWSRTTTAASRSADLVVFATQSCEFGVEHFSLHRVARKPGSVASHGMSAAPRSSGGLAVSPLVTAKSVANPLVEQMLVSGPSVSRGKDAGRTATLPSESRVIFKVPASQFRIHIRLASPLTSAEVFQLYTFRSNFAATLHVTTDYRDLETVKDICRELASAAERAGRVPKSRMVPAQLDAARDVFVFVPTLDEQLAADEGVPAFVFAPQLNVLGNLPLSSADWFLTRIGVDVAHIPKLLVGSLVLPLVNALSAAGRGLKQSGKAIS